MKFYSPEVTKVENEEILDKLDDEEIHWVGGFC
jgi:hypothetical protein